VDTRLQTPRGTTDYLPEESYKRRVVEDSFRRTFKLWGYQEVRTPTFEFFQVLATGTGAELEDSMFKFQDKSGRLLALRAEMTASIARVVGTQLLNEPKPIRLWYIANMFRYDEPQAGRQREFWQAGVELVGSDMAKADTEVVALMIQALRSIGLRDVRVDIGHVGIFKEIVKEARLDTKLVNAIRISIDKKDRQGLEQALKTKKIDEQTKNLLRALPESRGGAEVLDKLSGLVDNLKIKYIIDDLKKVLSGLRSYRIPEESVTLDLGIIRGLDYYTGAVFEAYVPDLGIAIGGGGRYDGLIGEFASYDIPATGFAIGIDRCIMALKKQKFPYPEKVKASVLILPVSEKMNMEVNKIANQLREEGIPVETEISGWKVSKGLSYANKMNIPYVIIVGEEEYKSDAVVVKNMKAKKQNNVKIKELTSFMKGKP
jgi:ATP phosphoribosyltransferase regulatory subunit